MEEYKYTKDNKLDSKDILILILMGLLFWVMINTPPSQDFIDCGGGANCWDSDL